MESVHERRCTVLYCISVGVPLDADLCARRDFEKFVRDEDTNVLASWDNLVRGFRYIDNRFTVTANTNHHEVVYSASIASKLASARNGETHLTPGEHSPSHMACYIMSDITIVGHPGFNTTRRSVPQCPNWQKEIIR
jgi:hypothetical protein